MPSATRCCARWRPRSPRRCLRIALQARLGGDEFSCGFLFDPAQPETVERIAEKLVSRMAQPFEAEGLRLHISCSLGVARSDFDCASIDALIRSADIAMYAAKKSGRNRFAWFDQSMERELQVRNELEIGAAHRDPADGDRPLFRTARSTSRPAASTASRCSRAGSIRCAG